jgi:pimeloyl-ACP methyl ester carboxylesterase
MNTKFATSPDHTVIVYDVCGAGPAILLIHGGGGSRQDWHDGGYVRRLQDEFQVIGVDLRGHGESDKPTDRASYTTGKFGQDLLAVADACGIERFTIWGYSFGGNVSRYLASCSKRVAKLILIGTSLGPGVSNAFQKDIQDFQAHWSPLVQAQLGNPPQGIFNLNLLSPEDRAELQRREISGAWLPVILAFSRAMLDWGFIGPADLLCPTLWLVGTENLVAMQSLKTNAAALHATPVRAHVFDGLNHPQEFEAIDTILPVMLDFTRTRESPLPSGRGRV